MMKTGLLALGAMLSLAVPSGHAAGPARDTVQEEVVRQHDIYRSRGAATPSGYTVDRSLSLYVQGLATGFPQSLAALGHRDRWLDIGAGEGRAAVHYATGLESAIFEDMNTRPEADRRAQVVAMSIEDRRTDLWHDASKRLPPDRLKYLFGKTLGDYTLPELGRFQLITDVMGGFSYTPRLSVFTARTLQALTVGGTFYTVLADVHSESTDNPPHYEGDPHLTRILGIDGGEVKICQWLKRISCVEVTCEFKADWTPPIESYRVRKTCENVTVPALDLVHYTSGTPPERSFQLLEALPEGAAAYSGK